MMLQAIVEPVLIALKTDQHASGAAVARNQDFVRSSQAKESREIVFDLSQRHLADGSSRGHRATSPLRLS